MNIAIFKHRNSFKETKKATKSPFTVLTVIMLIVLVAYTVIMFTLLAWGLMSSVKSPQDYKDHSYQFPKTIYNNLVYIFNFSYSTTVSYKDVGLVQMFGNSIMYALGCSIVKTTITCVAAYACAKFRYKFSNVLYNVVIIVMIIPIVGSVPAELDMATRMGLYNKMWGIWLMQANFLGMYFLVFYVAFKKQPKSYIEAAKIDGAGNTAIMMKISFPLISNMFFTILLLNFIVYWNDYQTPLIYIPDYPTAAYAVLRMKVETNNPYKLYEAPYVLSCAILLMLPILILFLCCQKRLLGNLNVGGIKG